MHRTRTRFAARINRVASGLERRGVVATYELHDRLLANRASRRRYEGAQPQLDAVQADVLARLRTDGYATLPFSDLISDENIWNELEADAARFVAETEAGLRAEREGGAAALRRRAGKEFLVRKYAWGAQLALDDPWLRVATNPRMLDLANAYLGMWSKVEYVDVWYTPPAGADERRSSQRWHRDFNDRHLLKAFLYLVTSTRMRGRSNTSRAARRAASSTSSGPGVRSVTTTRPKTSWSRRSAAGRSRSRPRRGR